MIASFVVTTFKLKNQCNDIEIAEVTCHENEKNSLNLVTIY